MIVVSTLIDWKLTEQSKIVEELFTEEKRISIPCYLYSFKSPFLEYGKETTCFLMQIKSLPLVIIATFT